jgi:inner membrane protease subunit 2
VEAYGESAQGNDCCVLVSVTTLKTVRLPIADVFPNRSPYHPEVTSVKRIIALEGDTVYTRAPYPFPTAVVPLNHVWVEGDNRDGSKTLDSNYYGPIAMPLIQGKVTHVLWPWNSFGSVRWWEFKGRTRVIKGRREDAPHFD